VSASKRPRPWVVAVGAYAALHLRKIDLADQVLVVNPGGYIGESTSREIAYARDTGKPVSFTDRPSLD